MDIAYGARLQEVMGCLSEESSAIARMSCTGPLDVKTVRGTVNDDTFYNFVQMHLLPHLMPFDGRNPHSVVVMDNCFIHHVQEVVTSIQDVGALVHLLASYSPDYNPIEELFKGKAQVKGATDAAHNRLACIITGCL